MVVVAAVVVTVVVVVVVVVVVCVVEVVVVVVSGSVVVALCRTRRDRHRQQCTKQPQPIRRLNASPSCGKTAPQTVSVPSFVHRFLFSIWFQNYSTTIWLKSQAFAPKSSQIRIFRHFLRFSPGFRLFLHIFFSVICDRIAASLHFHISYRRSR